MVAALERNPSGRRTIIRNDFTGSSITATHGGAIAAQPKVVAAQPTKRSSKGRVKSSTVAVYTGAFALLVAVIAIGYRTPQQEVTAVSAATVTNSSASKVANQPAVNDVVATDIAASVALAADLAIAPNVAERAVSTRVQSQYSSNDVASEITKPTIVQLSAASRNISTYAVQAGDTVQSIAAKFGISADTIKWANNLTGDTLAAGSSLTVLPVSGITYTVKDGDTIATIADKYQANATQITSYNDLEISGVTNGLKIIIPNGVLPTTERPGYVTPVAAVNRYTGGTNGTYITGYSSGFSGGNTWHIRVGTPNNGRYAHGNCTAYVFDRRAELGRPIGTFWGNAGAWATNASRAGYTVNRTPAAGAVIQDAGHVAIVEKVLPNGDLELSEMNARVSGGGYNIVSGRILPAGQVGQYMYIH